MEPTLLEEILSGEEDSRGSISFLESRVGEETEEWWSDDSSGSEGGELPSEVLEQESLSAEARDSLLASKLALENEWVFWYDDKLPRGMSTDKYESAIKSLGKFDTVQDFWRYWNNLQKVVRFPDGTNLRLFKAGIKPMWEDPANQDGGKWVINSTNKGATNKVWSKLVLALIGEQFQFSEGLCGIVLSVRPKGDTINIWNNSGGNPEEIKTTTNELKALLGSQSVKYQLHRAVMEKIERKNVKKESKLLERELQRQHNLAQGRSKSLDFASLPANHRFSLERKAVESKVEEIKPSSYPELHTEPVTRRIELTADLSSKFVRAEPSSPMVVRAEPSSPSMSRRMEPPKEVPHKEVPLELTPISPVVARETSSTPTNPGQKLGAELPIADLGSPSPAGTPKKKRPWGDWSDVNFASSDESDRDSPVKKSWSDLQAPIRPVGQQMREEFLRREEILRKEEQLRKQEVMRREEDRKEELLRKQEMKGNARSLQRSASMNVPESRSSADTRAQVAAKKNSLGSPSKAGFKDRLSGSVDMARSRPLEIGNSIKERKPATNGLLAEISPSPKPVPRELSRGDAKSLTESPKEVWSRFSAGRGSMVKRGSTPEPTKARSKSDVGADADFIRQMEADRNSKEFEDPEEKQPDVGQEEVEPTPEMATPEGQEASRGVEGSAREDPNARPVTAEDERGGDSDEDSSKVVMRKQRTVKQQKSKPKTSRKPKQQKTEAVQPAFSSDYVIMLSGLVLVLVLMYLYQTGNLL